MKINNQTNHLKKEILIRLIKAFNEEDFAKSARLIPLDMRPKGCEVPYRCCVHKERAIIKDRTIASLGFSIEDDDERISLSEYAKKSLEREKPDQNVLTVLEDACKGCEKGKIFVTDLCQGCVARPCVNSCNFGAISIIDGKSVIDQTKCKKCTKCVNECPYGAIVKVKVPCEDKCPVNAIQKDESGHAKIDFEKCISCGKCVAACPFGAVHEKSQIIDVLKNIKSGKKVIALIAPAVAGQLLGNIYQLRTAIKKCGFYDVFEVAQGADITSMNESEDFQKRIVENKDSFMTTSCCAAYNELIEKHLQEIKPFVSDTKTPLFYTAQLVKEKYPDSITVFVSPCVAKKKEGMKNPNVDYVINCEELGAMFVASQIELSACDEEKFAYEASKEGREFAITGGVAQAVIAASKDKGNLVKTLCINGLNKDSIKALKRYAKNGKCDEDANLIEVMSCEGGCVGGNATLNTSLKAAKRINEFNKDGKSLADF